MNRKAAQYELTSPIFYMEQYIPFSLIIYICEPFSRILHIWCRNPDIFHTKSIYPMIFDAGIIYFHTKNIYWCSPQKRILPAYLWCGYWHCLYCQHPTQYFPSVYIHRSCQYFPIVYIQFQTRIYLNVYKYSIYIYHVCIHCQCFPSVTKNGNHNSKTKNLTKKNQEFKNPVQNIAHLFCCFSQMDKILRFLNVYISKTKNQKFDFLFVSEHCASFWTKK